MGNGRSKVQTNPSLRLIPREAAQEKFYVKEEEEDYPPAKVATTLKKDIYNPKDNADIYEHALNASPELEDSWEDLINYLTSIYRTDMMKIRSIFSWLGCQDIERETFKGVSTDHVMDTPRSYKRLIKERNGSYAAFFCLLCRRAGLKCAIINGISKGTGYKVGDTDVSHLRDRWNAVYVDGWRLIHPLWAFKRITAYKDGEWAIPEAEEDIVLRYPPQVGETAHNFNEYYFLVDPSELINVCLPDKQKWQMTNPIMTLKKWVNVPFLQKRYHKDGYKVNEFCNKSQLTAVDGVSAIVIKAPVEKNETYQMSYDFFFNHVLAKPQVESPIYLKRYVLLSRDIRDNRWTFEVRMPIPGTYRIAVYGGPSKMKKQSWLCDVGFLAERIPEHIKPYPDAPDIGYGPVAMTEDAGLVEPSHPSGRVFINPRQEYHMTFKIVKTIDAYAELVSPFFPKKKLQQWLTCVMNNPSKLQILDLTVKVIEEGEFAVKIYSRPRDTEEAYRNVCNYYLSTDTPREHGSPDKRKHNQYKTATETRIRQGMDEAEKSRSLDLLKAAVQKFEEKGLRDDDGSYVKAAKKLHYMTLAKGIRDGINRRNLDLLEKAITKAEGSEHAHKMAQLLEKGRAERDRLKEVRGFSHAILEMKQSTITELVSYNKPIPVINDVLVGTLLLLGENADNLQMWEHVKACMRRTGQESFLRRVKTFDHSRLSVGVVNDVSHIVAMYDEDTVKAASAGAATFYCWMKSIVEEMTQQQTSSDLT